MSLVIALDVNETLLDLSALDDPFEELFGCTALRGQWFAQMLQLSFVGGLTGDYIDFTTAQHAALHMIADLAGQQITERAGGGDGRSHALVAASPGGRRGAGPAAPDAADPCRADKLRPGRG